MSSKKEFVKENTLKKLNADSFRENTELEYANLSKINLLLNATSYSKTVKRSHISKQLKHAALFALKERCNSLVLDTASRKDALDPLNFVLIENV